jgi:hypothetical protein
MIVEFLLVVNFFLPDGGMDRFPTTFRVDDGTCQADTIKEKSECLLKACITRGNEIASEKQKDEPDKYGISDYVVICNKQEGTA